MENHKPTASTNRSSKRNPSKSQKPEKENCSASRLSQKIAGAKVSSKSKATMYTEPDGSSERHTLERCPSPLYSHEDQSILQGNQSDHFNDFEIIVKEEDEEEKEVMLVTIEEVSENTSPVARRHHRNRKQATSHPICFIESQTAKIPRLRRMELKVKELISTVQTHPELWDPSNHGYSDRQKKTAAWSSVCRHLYPEWDDLDSRDKGILDNDVRKRWRSDRDQFRREIVQRETQNGLAPPSKKPYIYMEELMFLMPVLDLRPANTNEADADVQADQEHQLEESEPKVQAATTPVGGVSDPSDGRRSMCSEEPPTTNIATSVSQRILPLQLRGSKDKKTSCSLASADTIDSQVLAYLQKNIEEDSEDAFVRSLGSYIRKVPERWRLWLRSGIQTLIEACIPPNNPEKVLGLLDQVKLACPPSTDPLMDIEFMAPLVACQSPSHPHCSLSTSSRSPPSSHSFPRLPSYHSNPSTHYTQDSPSQLNYAFHSHREPSSHASFPSNIPPSSSSSSDLVPMSTPSSCLAAYGSMSTSPLTDSSCTVSRPQSQ